MKARFFAFLAAVAVGSAGVLIYASQSRQSQANASLGSAEDCSACAMSTAKAVPAVAASMAATDECCAADAAKPAVASLDVAGCPYVAGDTNATVAADVTTAKAATDACCAMEAAATPTVAAQVEK